jgi:hypothetical protein
MEIVDVATPLGQKLVPAAKPPMAVLATPDESLIGNDENKNESLRVDQVETFIHTAFNSGRDQQNFLAFQRDGPG